MLNWWGLTAPAKTPVAVVERVNAEVARFMAKATSKERLVSEGAESAAGTPAEFAAMLRAEIAKWGKVGREIDLKID